MNLAWGGFARRTSAWSLQGQLIGIAIVVTTLAWVGGVTATILTARLEAEKLHDRKLQQIASVLLSLSGHELLELGEAATVEARLRNGRVDTMVAFGDDYRFQLWSHDGHLLLGNFGLPSAAAMARLGQTGFSWIEMDRQRWRVFALHSDQTSQDIHVAERATLREWTPSGLAGSLAWLLLPTLITVLLPTLWLLRRLLRPLQDLANSLQARSASNLDQLQVSRPPRELDPIVRALNTLFSRLADAWRRESGFTALAAHELRTPLATLRVLADAVCCATGEVDRSRTLREFVVCVDHCAHLQQQLLTLSRLDASKGSDLKAEVELTDVVDEVMLGLLQEARRASVKLVSRMDGTAVLGHRFGVLTLVRNLVANGVRYTPAGGRVEISSTTQGTSVFVRVDDSGPGIPQAEREHVFERFVRLRPDVQSGVGLGLSIVRTVATAHDATVTLAESPLGGLRVVVEFRGRAIQRLPLIGDSLPDEA